jgi:hypothetical protein
MKRLRSRAGLTAIAALMAACTSSRLPDDKTAQMPSPGPQSEVSKEPPPALVPQAEGTPLPPRDPRIAERWPPEIKQLVDNMLTLYRKTSDEKPMSVKEVAQKMGITLTEKPLTTDEARTWHKRFLISGTPYMDPEDLDQYGALGQSYSILRSADSQGRTTQHLQLVTSRKQTGFCLDPYELAVYTGSTFVNTDTSPHAGIRYWPPAYVWGMFGWSNTGRYGGQGYSIHVDRNRDPVTREIMSTGCVHTISVVGGYQEEKEQSMTTINQTGVNNETIEK